MGFLDTFIPPCSRDAFAHKVMAQLKKRKVPGPFRYNQTDFSLSTADNSNMLFLSNAYAEYCAAPFAMRAKVIRQYAVLGAGGPNTIPSTFVAARARTLPRVRERFYHESISITFLLKGLPVPEIPQLRLNDHLVANLIYDAPESVSMIDVKTLRQWNISFEDAIQIARDNLWKISNENFHKDPSGLFVAPWKDSHAATRLFLHDLIWQLQVDGAHVAMIPNRDTLLVAGENDHDALLKMAELAQQAMKEPRFMIGTAFRLNENKWEPFLPASDSPAYPALRMLHVQSMGQMYSEQKRLLEAKFQNVNFLDPSFVATFSGVSAPDGSLITFASWAENVETLLPEADNFALGIQAGDAHKPAGFVDARAALREFGDLLEPMDVYPPRWRTKGFPSAEMLSKIAVSETPIEPNA